MRDNPIVTSDIVLAAWLKGETVTGPQLTRIAKKLKTTLRLKATPSNVSQTAYAYGAMMLY